jgi:DNA-directed RNA polymerase subunit RPC12/RpoP
MSLDTEKLGYKEYKCNLCGWVHAALPLRVVEPDMYNVQYYKCFRCGAPSAGFVPAEPDESMTGSTMQGVFVPGAWGAEAAPSGYLDAEGAANG